MYLVWDADNSVLEVFSGDEEFIKQPRKKNIEVLPPVDLEQVWDLSKPSHEKELLEVIRRSKPNLLKIATPCTPWPVAATINKDKKASARM
eukprot:9940499-Heterocapsa_arctica.AAC.1